MKLAGDDKIEVDAIDKKGRIYIRERQASGWGDIRTCSIYLTPDQLEEHARECLAIAAKIRSGS